MKKVLLFSAIILSFSSAFAETYHCKSSDLNTDVNEVTVTLEGAQVNGKLTTSSGSSLDFNNTRSSQGDVTGLDTLGRTKVVVIETSSHSESYKWTISLTGKKAQLTEDVWVDCLGTQLRQTTMTCETTN